MACPLVHSRTLGLPDLGLLTWVEALTNSPWKIFICLSRDPYWHLTTNIPARQQQHYSTDSLLIYLPSIANSPSDNRLSSWQHILCESLPTAVLNQRQCQLSFGSLGYTVVWFCFQVRILIATGGDMTGVRTHAVWYLAARLRDGPACWPAELVSQ